MPTENLSESQVTSFEDQTETYPTRYSHVAEKLMGLGLLLSGVTAISLIGCGLNKLMALTDEEAKNIKEELRTVKFEQTRLPRNFPMAQKVLSEKIQYDTNELARHESAKRNASTCFCLSMYALAGAVVTFGSGFCIDVIAEKRARKTHLERSMHTR